MRIARWALLAAAALGSGAGGPGRADEASAPVEAWQHFQQVLGAAETPEALRPFVVHGELVRGARRVGTWSLMARRSAAGEVPGWRLAEVLRLDGHVELARESRWTPSLRLVDATLRRRSSAGTRRVTLEAEGDTVKIREHDGEPRVEPFGGSALAGVAPYVLLAPVLARAPGVYRSTHVYDDMPGPVRLAARDLDVGLDPGEAGTVHIALQGVGAVTLRVDIETGAVRTLAVATPEGEATLVEGPYKDDSAPGWDLLTAEPTTPVVAATRFLYALERGYLDLAARLVAWSADLGVPGTDVDSMDTPGRRAWLEARRIELRRGLRPAEAAARLQGVRAELDAQPDRIEVSASSARIRLPAPYSGWDLLLVRDAEGTWRVAGTAESRPR